MVLKGDSSVKSRKYFISIVTISVVVLMLGACSLIKTNKSPLNPDKPITITLWHYYSGHIKEQFDELVSRFNETEGVKQGIVVEARSLGDVSQLADAVFDAANEKIGSEPLPDLFMAYPDNAFRVRQIVELVDIESRLSEDEIKVYRRDFLEEGRIGEEKKLYIMPIAKSTENLYLNKNFWDDFSKQRGVTLEQLATWEGVVEVAKQYYEYSGKAFMGIDAVANYMQVVSMQLGEEIYRYDGMRGSLFLSEKIAKTFWDYFYTPYLRGYFEKNGRFSSDDAKVGSTIAYTGSTAGAAYFPIQVTLQENEIYEVEPYTLPYPYFQEGEKVAIQQGAGLCITKSSEAREFAGLVFLKWFTAPEQNLEFTVSTGYFPVTTEALQKERLLEQVEASEVVGAAIPKMIQSTSIMFEEYRFYSSKPFEGSYELRVLMENHLFSKITKDLEELQLRVAGGENRETIIEEMIHVEEFQKWYQQILQEAGQITNE